MGSEYDDLSSLDLTDINVFGGNKFSQAGDAGLLTPTSSTTTPQSPVGPCDFSSQESPGIKLTDTTAQTLLSLDGDWALEHIVKKTYEHSHPGNAAFLSTSWNINGPSSQSPVPCAARPTVVHIEAADDDLARAVVGSPQIQQAAGKRRKKNGIYQCPYRKAGCLATFTARHNLRYHLNAHWGQKPYKCVKCSYAAAAPANTKRHQATCKGLTRDAAHSGIAEERNEIVPRQDYSPSQELADIQLTDHVHFSFGGNEVSHPGDNLWSIHIPANGAAGPPRLPTIATPSPQSSVGLSAAGPSVIKMEAVDDDLMAAELSRIQQAANKPSQRRGEIAAMSNSTVPCIDALKHREKRTRRRKKGRKH
ncbi:hypothetical protein JOM56_013951 [Amanita muscaria]